MIEFKGVTKVYNGNYFALEDINFSIKEGEFVSIVGQSGAGKTTLLKLLTHEELPTQGEVIIDGVNVVEIKEKDIPLLRRMVGTIFQDFKLLSNKTVYENVAFALEVAGATDEKITEDVQQVLNVVGLDDKVNNFPHELAGGEKQRVSIARALIHRPKILLADEPTGNLDLTNKYDVVKLLMKINGFGTTVILATHDDKSVNLVGKRVIALDRGKIVSEQPDNGKYPVL
jgi:cell division transport system ATP-binding protein